VFIRTCGKENDLSSCAGGKSEAVDPKTFPKGLGHLSRLLLEFDVVSFIEL
jgi:hypothetical protein